MEKYAIVRVDRYPICPLGFKHKCEDFIKTGICDCKHGDTKEQLKKKIKTPLRAFLSRKPALLSNEDYDILVQKIVEFLGVEG